MQLTGLLPGGCQCSRLLEGRRPQTTRAPFAALRVARRSKERHRVVTCGEAASLSPPSTPKAVAASAAPPTSVPKRRGAQPMMKERAVLQASELVKVAQRAQRGQLGQQAHNQQQQQQQLHMRSPTQQQPPSPFHSASQPSSQYQQQVAVPQQQRRTPQPRAGLRQVRQEPQRQQQHPRERMHSPAEAATSTGIPQRSRLLQRRAPQRAVSSVLPRVPPPLRPELQAAVKSNKARDWQVTRDWLIMELDDIRLDDETFWEIMRSCSLEEHWRPQIALYHQLGMNKAELCKLANARRQLFSLSVPTVRSKLAFLRNELAMDDADIRKVLLKFPRIIEYKTERTVRPRLDFLLKHGVVQSDLSKVVLRAPQTMELHVEDTLEPRVAFLRHTVGVAQENIGKVITRLPAVLTYTEDFMQQRVDFLRATGLSPENLAKAVTSHPQVLHYRVESMEEKLQYLRSIGMGPEQVAVVLQRLPQLLSLDIRNNLVPKYNYLQAELGGSMQTVASYPAYFSLSLPLRIMPRHRYLQLVRSPQKVWPFPMNYLKCSDLLFAANVANTPLDKFEAFKEQFVAGRARDQLLAVQH